MGNWADNGPVARLFQSLCEDAEASTDLAGFRRRLLERLLEIVEWHMALVLPPGPLGDDRGVGAVAVDYDTGLLDLFLKNRRQYYPTLMPLIEELRARHVVDAFAILGPSLRRTEVYRQIVVPSGIGAQLHALLSFRGKASGVISLKRRKGAAPFTGGDFERIGTVLSMAGLADAAVHAQLAPDADETEVLDCLSQRERQVCALIRTGMRNKEIAAVLGTAVDTVRKQSIALYEKLGVNGRLELLTQPLKLAVLDRQMLAYRKRRDFGPARCFESTAHHDRPR